MKKSPSPSAGVAWALFHLFVVALFLRFWDIGFGLPEPFHPDEGVKVEPIRRLAEGRRPGYFHHPGLLLNHVALTLRAGAAAGFFGTPPEASGAAAGAASLDDASVIRIGRIVVAVMGALTLFLLYFLARSVLGPWGAVAAAALLVFAPLHVIHSRYMKEDIHLVFGVALALLGLIRWQHSIRDGSAGRGWFAVALVGAGWAVASKILGILMLPVILAAIWRQEFPRKNKVFLTALAAGQVLLVFAILSPQVFLDFESVMRDVPREFRHGTINNISPRLMIWQWPDLGTWYLFRSIGPGLSWPVAILGLAGLGLAIARRRQEPDLFLLSVTALLWYGAIELSPIKRGVDVERYALPCLVPMSILAVWAGRMAIERWMPAWRRSPIPGVAPIVALVAIPLLHSIVLVAAVTPDTRQLASRWLTDNAPPSPIRLGVLTPVYPGVRSPRASVVFLNISSPDQMKASSRNVDAISIESFFTDRYERFPHLSRTECGSLDWLREEFPHAVVFRKSSLLRAGFHNPVVEIRFRNPPPTATGNLEQP